MAGHADTSSRHHAWAHQSNTVRSLPAESQGTGGRTQRHHEEAEGRTIID
jgi:hypothetical protein